MFDLSPHRSRIRIVHRGMRLAILSVRMKVLMLLLLFSFTTQSQQQTIHVVSEKSLSYYPVDETADSGIAAGLDALFLTHLLDSLGYETNLEVLPWSRAYQRALNTPNTLIHSMARTPQREDKFHWVEAYMELEYGLYSLGEKPRFNIKSGEDLHKLTIAAQRNDSLYKALTDIGLKHIQTVLHYNMLYDMLAKNRIDLIPASRETAAIRCQQLNICQKLQLEYSLSHINGTLYLAFNKQTDIKIVEDVRRAFQQKVESGEYLHLFPGRRLVMKQSNK